MPQLRVREENFATGVRRIEDYLSQAAATTCVAPPIPDIKIAVLEWGLVPHATTGGRACTRPAACSPTNKLEPRTGPDLPGAADAQHHRRPEWTRVRSTTTTCRGFAGSGYVVEKLFRDHYAPRRTTPHLRHVRDIANRADVLRRDLADEARGLDARTPWTRSPPGTADGRRLVIKAVNYDGARHTLLTRLQGSRVPANATVKLVTLTAGLDEANSLAEPDKLRRLETTKPYTRDMAFELPPYTVAVIEIRAN